MTTLELDRLGGPVPSGAAGPHAGPRPRPATGPARTADDTGTPAVRPVDASVTSRTAGVRSTDAAPERAPRAAGATGATGASPAAAPPGEGVAPAPSARPPGAAGRSLPRTARTARSVEPVDAAPASTVPEARLVPTLPPAPRPAPSTGPGHTRPPTLEQRLLARRRATLAAERAARADVPPRETPAMPDPTPVCCALALAATEAMRGTRSVAQLARWVSPQVFEQLAARSALTVRVLGRAAATRRPEVLRVRVCRLGEHVAEAAVVVDDGTRVRAVALRLEMWRGAWRAVAFEIG